MWSDPHYDPTYWTRDGKPESCAVDLAKGKRGPFGDFECDPPWEIVPASVDAMLQKVPSPEFLIINGYVSYLYG